MTFRSTVAALICCAAIAAVATVSCGSAGMTSSTSLPTPSEAPASPLSTRAQSTTGAPITVLSATPTSISSHAAPSTTGSTATVSSAPPTTTELTPTVVETTVNGPTPTVPAGTVVVIDPGHNGGNASNPGIINKQVPAGFGQFKACNTTGTATNAGYSEHAFNWNVALALKKVLQDHGMTVLMTRDSDTGVGPCVNERAAIGNDANAAAVISIHGDGEAAAVDGFFVMTASRPPAGADIAAATEKLATDIRDGMVDSGMKVSNALGKHGLWARGDLGGLNLSLRPTVMIECGNMRNAAEAAEMSSAAGQKRYAQAIAAGVLAFLAR